MHVMGGYMTTESDIEYLYTYLGQLRTERTCNPGVTPEVERVRAFRNNVALAIEEPADAETIVSRIRRLIADDIARHDS